MGNEESGSVADVIWLGDSLNVLLGFPYLKKIDNEVYVLHCFEKQSAQTEQHDINTAKARFKRLQEQQRKERRDVKRGKEPGVSSDTRKRSR